jgi:hypothetical protein
MDMEMKIPQTVITRTNTVETVSEQAPREIKQMTQATLLSISLAKARERKQIKNGTTTAVSTALPCHNVHSRRKVGE